MVLKILVRKNLKMSPGKTAAQACHAALGLVGIDETILYDGPVIVLFVSDAKFNEAKRVHHREGIKYGRVYVVRDAGLTELKPGTETCLAFWD